MDMGRTEVMSSRDRVMAALTGQMPDRIPYIEVYIDEEFAHRVLGLPPPHEPSPMSGESPLTARYFGGLSYDPLQLARILGLDCLCASVQPQIYFRVKVSEGQKFVVDGLVHTRADLPLVQLVNPDNAAPYAPLRNFIDQVHGAGLAAACFINLGSDPVVLSMGWDHFSYALYDDPALVHTLFDMYSSWFAQALKHVCKLGFDFIWAGDDIAYKSGPIISLRTFREFFLPYYRRVAEAITLPWIFHTDGNFLPLLGDLLSLGMNALHPLEPDAVDIGEIRRLVNGRVGLVGNIDINLLSEGTPEQVAKRTLQTMQIAAPGGRYILSSSNSLTRGCKVENVLAMIRTCRDYGSAFLLE
jgi:uroporphyrinogen decarboxylase